MLDKAKKFFPLLKHHLLALKIIIAGRPSKSFMHLGIPGACSFDYYSSDFPCQMESIDSFYLSLSSPRSSSFMRVGLVADW